MPTTRAQLQEKIDSLMESASHALVERRYFDCEALCVEALERAFVGADYERMARIMMPLEECRRQKRDLALDSRAVFIVDGVPPTGRGLRSGCYLVAPPRVGIDGRLLREAANKKKIPVVIVVREPASRDGMWPVVSIGPVTIRTKVPPPAPPLSAPPLPHPASGSPPPPPPGKPTRAPKPRSKGKTPAADLPPPEWFILANEAIGDKAISEVGPDAAPVARVEALFKCLQAHPDHEKLHQVLAEACRAAAKAPVKVSRPKPLRAASMDDEGI